MCNYKEKKDLGVDRGRGHEAQLKSRITGIFHLKRVDRHKYTRLVLSSHEWAALAPDFFHRFPEQIYRQDRHHWIRTG